MSNLIWCHGPKCHERETTTRVRGNKGSKVLRTMKVSDRWRQGSWHEYFCDQTCLMEYIKKHLRNIVAIAPCTEAKETPIEDPYKDPQSYYYWTFEKKRLTMLDLSYIIQDMKEIKYNNKVYKLPFAVSLPEDPTAEEEISNRFNGEKTKLPAFAVAVYDVIMGSEMLKQWDDHRKGLDWFIKYFPKQYMVLLD